MDQTSIAHISCPADSDLSYEDILRQTLAIVEAAESLHFTGLSAEDPFERKWSSSLLGRAQYEAEEKSPIAKKEDLEAALGTWKMEIRSGSGVSVKDEDKAAMFNKRAEMIERVMKAKKKKLNGIEPHGLWVKELMRASIQATRKDLVSVYSDALTRFATPHVRVKHVKYVNFVPARTKKALLAIGQDMHNYFRTTVDNPLGELINKKGDAAEAEWKRLLWLQARAAMWADEVNDAYIASTMAETAGALARLMLIVPAADKLGVRMPVEPAELNALHGDLKQMAVQPLQWPADEDSVRKKTESAKLLREVAEAVNAHPHVLLPLEIAVTEQAAALIDKGNVDASALHHHEERTALTEKLDTLREEIRRLDHHPERLNNVARIVIDWTATIFQHNLRLHSDQLKFGPPQKQRSLGAGGVGVAAAISARTAKRYNI